MNFGRKDCKTEYVSEFTHYIRIGMVTVKTSLGTPYNLFIKLFFFIQVYIVIKQEWLTLDHWVCPINNSPKESGGVKKATGWKKKTEWNNNKLYGPFYGWFSTASRLEPLWGGSLLYNTKFPEIPDTHFINLRRTKGWVDLGSTQWFWTWVSRIVNPAPWPLDH